MSKSRPGRPHDSRRFSSFSAFSLTAPLLALCLPAGQAEAQSQLEPVIVTGTREPQPLKESAADVTAISAQTIRRSTADSVEDLLRREAGVQVSRPGGPGQPAGFFVRGAPTGGTVLLIDGVRVGSASLGYAELESLSVAQIDHIEVLRGPASSLYGADAVGGVVQIFTRRGDGSPRLTGHAAIGGYRSREADVGVSGSQGPFDYAALLGRESSGGVSAIRPGDRNGYYNPDDDGFSRNAGDLRLGYSPAAGHRIGVALTASRLNTRYDSAEYDAAFKPDPSPDFRTRLRTSVASLDYRGEVSTFWTTTAQMARNSDDSRSGGTTQSRYKTIRDQATWQNALHFGPDQQVLAAYEYLRESVEADSYTDRPVRHNNAAVLGYAGRFGASGLEASLRHDDNSAYGRNTTGSVGTTFAVTDELKLRALAGTTFRAPTFNDLYYPQYGVATVKPERGRSVELGVAWQSGSRRASATVYRNRVRDLINYDPDPNGTDCPKGFFGCATNIGRARLQGATFSAADRFGALDLRGTVDLLDAKDADSGVRLPRRAAHQETVAADYGVGRWSIGGSVVDVGSRPDAGTRLGGYGLVDLRASWHFLPQWRLEAKLLNALDHRVEPLRDYQGLGRQGWIGIRFDGAGV